MELGVGEEDIELVKEYGWWDLFRQAFRDLVRFLVGVCFSTMFQIRNIERRNKRYRGVWFFIYELEQGVRKEGGREIFGMQ